MFQDDRIYAFEAADMRTLDSIRRRLYEDKPLSGDQRRDLANQLDAVLHKAVEIKTHTGV